MSHYDAVPHEFPNGFVYTMHINSILIWMGVTSRTGDAVNNMDELIIYNDMAIACILVCIVFNEIFLTNLQSTSNRSPKETQYFMNSSEYHQRISRFSHENHLSRIIEYNVDWGVVLLCGGAPSHSIGNIWNHLVGLVHLFKANYIYSKPTILCENFKHRVRALFLVNKIPYPFQN